MQDLPYLLLDENVLEVTAGSFHNCALLDSGKVKCWGNNEYGQLGLGHTLNIGNDLFEFENVPPVFLGENVLQIAAGENHTCVLLESKNVKCWGINEYGQLGQGNVNSIGKNNAQEIANLPVISLGEEVKQITAGAYHNCALLVSGKVKCWGYNYYGQLGLGHTKQIGHKMNSIATLSSLNIGEEVKSIYAGGNHTCALLQSDELKCWGLNKNGQLGKEDNLNFGNNETLVLTAVPLL